MAKEQDGAVQGRSLVGTRQVRVLVPMLAWYEKALCQSRLETFNDGLCGFRDEKKLSGPDIRVTRKILRTGFASPEMADLILEYLRDELIEAYKRGTLTPETAPMIVQLDEWPEGHPMRRMAEAGRASGMVLRPEYVAEMTATILNSSTDHELCACVGGAFALRDLMEGLKGNGRPKIERILIRKLSEAYAAKLVELDLLPKEFCKALKENIAWLRTECSQYKIHVVEAAWQGRPLIHGMMYTDVVLYHAYWQLRPEGLSTVGGWLHRVYPGPGSEFADYGELFSKGN
jgi:hypothetical protein